MLLTLPAFGFSLGDLLNATGKTDEPKNPVSANQPESVSDSVSGAAASESAIGGQQDILDVDRFLKGIAEQSQANSGGSPARNPDSPSNAQATGGGCQKNEQGEIVC